MTKSRVRPYYVCEAGREKVVFPADCSLTIRNSPRRRRGATRDNGEVRFVGIYSVALSFSRKRNEFCPTEQQSLRYSTPPAEIEEKRNTNNH